MTTTGTNSNSNKGVTPAAVVVVVAVVVRKHCLCGVVVVLRTKYLGLVLMWVPIN